MTPEIAAKRFLQWAQASTEARHPWNSPEWFGRVATSLPAPVVARAAGHTARALVVELIAAEQFRAKQSFLGGAA